MNNRSKLECESLFNPSFAGRAKWKFESDMYYDVWKNKFYKTYCLRMFLFRITIYCYLWTDIFELFSFPGQFLTETQVWSLLICLRNYENLDFNQFTCLANVQILTHLLFLCEWTIFMFIDCVTELRLQVQHWTLSIQLCLAWPRDGMSCQVSDCQSLSLHFKQ